MVMFAWPVPGQVAPDFRLLDLQGFSHELYRYHGYEAVILVAAEDVGAAGLIRQAFRPHLTGLGQRVKLLVLVRERAPVSEEERAGVLFPAVDPVLFDENGIVQEALALSPGELLLVRAHDWAPVLRTRWTPEDLEETVQDFHTAFSALEALAALPPVPVQREALPTYPEIASILERRCCTCHHPGGMAPFGLTSHQKIRGWASMIEEVLLTQRMPPWFAEDPAGQFCNNLEMPAAERKALLRWLRAGALWEGGTDPLQEMALPPSDPWPAGPPGLILRLPDPQSVPADGLLDYRHIEIPLDLPEDVWLRGIHVRPTNPRVVHHVLMFLEEPGKTVDLRGEFLASFLPGGDVDMFPEGTGKLLPRDARLLLQLHYTPSGRVEDDQTEIGLYLHSDAPHRMLRTGSAFARDFLIPPGAVFPVQASYTFTADATLYAMRPHMHYRGRRMVYEANYPDGRDEVLLSVPAYNFYWQSTYRLREPRHMPKGTIIACRGLMDNSAANPFNPDPSISVGWGHQSTDEMFVGDLRFVYVEGP